MLGDTEATQATLAEFGVDSTVGHAAKPIPTNAQGDMLEEVRSVRYSIIHHTHLLPVLQTVC